MRSRQIADHTRSLRLSRAQREAVVGMLLGGAHLETQDHGRTYRLKVEHSDAHRSYLEHLWRLFRGWVGAPLQPTRVVSRGHVRTHWWFQTISHGAFRFYAAQFYRQGRRRVPHLIHRWLTPRGLAYWFMEGGSLTWRPFRSVVFSTQGYDRGDAERLASALQRVFGLETLLRRRAEGYQVVIVGRSVERFVALIRPYVVPEMRDTLPPAGQTELPKR